MDFTFLLTGHVSYFSKSVYKFCGEVSVGTGRDLKQLTDGASTTCCGIVPMRNYSVAEEVLPNVQSCSGSEELHTVS